MNKTGDADVGDAVGPLELFPMEPLTLLVGTGVRRLGAKVGATINAGAGDKVGKTTPGAGVGGVGTAVTGQVAGGFAPILQMVASMRVVKALTRA